MSAIQRIAVNTDKDKETWLALRKQDVTASDAGALLGIHEFKTLLDLYGNKTGTLKEQPENDAMRRGKKLEGVAVDILREMHPEWKTEHGGWYLRDPASRLGATPDLFVECPARGRGVIQIKSVAPDVFGWKWKNKQTNQAEPPLWIAVQTILEGYLDGAKWAAAAAIVVDKGIDVHVVDVPIMPDIIERLKEESLKFWDMVEHGERPPADYNRDGETLKALYNKEPKGDILDLTHDNRLPEILARDAELKKQEKEIEAERERIDAEIYDKIGDAPGAICNGWTITAKRTLVTVKPKLQETHYWKRTLTKKPDKKEAA